MNKLICMVGLPRSGKSTYAKKFGFPIVCPDSIRLALHGQRFVLEAEDMIWSMTKIFIRSLFISGHERVVLDSTNITKKNRLRMRNLNWRCEYHIMSMGAEECIKRAEKMKDYEIIDVIGRMSMQFEDVTEDEGEVIKINNDL